MAFNILLDVLQSFFFQTWTKGNKKWGGVNLSMKKVIASEKYPKKSKPSEPIFWDEVIDEESLNISKRRCSFTGLK